MKEWKREREGKGEEKGRRREREREAKNPSYFATTLSFQCDFSVSFYGAGE